VRELKNFVETSIILNRGEVVRSDYIKSTLKLNVGLTTNDTLPIPTNKTPEQAERELIYRMLMALKLDMDELKQGMAAILQNGGAPKIPQSNFGETSDSANSTNDEIQPTTLSGMEREMIKETLSKYAGSRRKTARALQISERTLYRKINEYGL